MRTIRIFIISSASILLFTAAAKIFSSFSHGKILQFPDPLFSIKFVNLFRIVSVVEVIIALVCIFGRRIGIKIGLIIWLASNFTLYRLGLMVVDYRKPCNCLGTFTDMLRVSPEIADSVMKMILAYLLIGSYATLFWLWRQQRKSAARVASSGEKAAGSAP